MNRRRVFLGGAAAVAGAGALAAWRFWPDSGFWNPCRAGLPRRLATHELVEAAWEGLNPADVWDAHAHLAGTGDSPSGIYINPRMESVFNPQEYARRIFFLNGGCAYRSPGGVDEAYVARLLALMDGMKRGAKLVLFAFDRAHTRAPSSGPVRSIRIAPTASRRSSRRKKTARAS